MKRTLCLLVLASIALTGCGETRQDRVASGAMIGAGTGLVVGAAFGVPAIGTVVGTGVGVATAAATSKDQLYWGEPIWK